MMEEFLWEPDQDDNSNYSSSDDDPQPELKLSSFGKKMPIHSLSEILVITSTINGEPSVSSVETSSTISAPSITVIVYADAKNEVSSASTSDDEMLATVTDHPRKRKRNPSKRQ